MLAPRQLYALVALLSFAASALCARMLVGGHRLPGCGAASGCDAVLAGRRARWGRLPVAAVAMAGYFAGAVAALLAMPAGTPAPFARIALVALAPIFAGAAAWFAALQLLAVRRLCGYCVTVHAAGAAVAVLAVAAARGRGMEWAAVSLWTTPGWAALAAFIAGHVLLRPRMHEVRPAGREARNSKDDDRRRNGFDFPSLRPLNLFRISSFGFRNSPGSEPATSQAVPGPEHREIRNSKLEIRKKSQSENSKRRGRRMDALGFSFLPHLNLFRISGFGFRISPGSGQPPPQPSPGVPREGEIAAATHERHGPRGPAGAGSRRVRAFGGRVDLAVNEWPVLGSPGAHHIAVFLFDYTCRECRHMRRLIAAALARHPGRLAVLLLPVPIDPACNPAITRPNASRPDACGYVRLAWALWRADPLAHARVDEWLSAPPCAPPLRDAVAAAKKLAPAADLDTSHGSELGEFIDARIADAVAVYQALDGQPVPALLFPKTALRGHVESAAALLAIVEREMKLKPAARRAAARAQALSENSSRLRWAEMPWMRGVATKRLNRKSR